MMRLPFERSFNTRGQMFYALPQPAKPALRPGTGGAAIYAGPAWTPEADAASA